MNTRTFTLLLLATLWLTSLAAPASAQAASQQNECPALENMHIIRLESAETDFEEFQAQQTGILFFGQINANLDSVQSQENGQQLYCDYLAARQPIFPSNSSVYTYPYSSSKVAIALTEAGADIVDSPEQTPEPGQTGAHFPDRWLGMNQLIALMTGRNRAQGQSASDPQYTFDDLMLEPRALANAYLYARLWEADSQTWKTNSLEWEPLTIVAESFGTAFARTFLVALAERMTEIGYDEAVLQQMLASIRFLAIADVVPPFAQEAGSPWARLETIPTLSVLHADEDFARYYGAKPYYEHFVPFDDKGALTEGIWPLTGKRYLYVKDAIGQTNVHGVKPDVLAADPLWLDLWEHLQDGATLREALQLG